jgi:hypothetical protein
MKCPARAAGFAAVLLAASGCAPALHGTPREQIGQMRGRDVEATLHSGERVVLRSPIVEGDSVFGGWTSGPAGDVRAAVALEDIQSLRPVPMGPDPDSPQAFMQNMLMIAGIAAALLLAIFVTSM